LLNDETLGRVYTKTGVILIFKGKLIKVSRFTMLAGCRAAAVDCIVGTKYATIRATYCPSIVAGTDRSTGPAGPHEYADQADE
jgi:hypothetical protein